MSFSTDSVTSSNAEEIVASRIVELIAKPFSPRGLLDRIRETLESAERGGERAA